ncbi:hypothetical protein [Gordonia sp. 852002-51296_SCH5728562-b]|uniref:hypothetical protein n=1 Tax=Gordonia sp. 852002-51296_SCH5728562-b TaxID=1834101 RepID=UPI0007EBA799|nr:hypothetical protein [Gordonia sp. 852002-51296_SCH5728562-b]OBA38994.1 hypothetical protein A5766_04370 [Gordonia sp. 852002-51296_SCH5728562-b]
MDWGHYVDVANIVTAVSAVVAVVLATWLALKAIETTKAGNDTAERDLRYNQIDHTLHDLLALAAASGELAPDNPRDTSTSLRALSNRAEALESRLKVIEALGLPSERSNIDRVRELADDLQTFALARDRLSREGRVILADSVTEGAYTEEIWEELREIFQAPPHTFDDDDWIPEVSEARVEALRGKVGRQGATLTQSESVRLFATWARVVLGRAGFYQIGDGFELIDIIHDKRPDFLGQGTTPSDSDKLRADRVDHWVNTVLENAGTLWTQLNDERGTVVDAHGSPEAIATAFQRHLRDEFVSAAAGFVNDLRVTDGRGN